MFDPITSSLRKSRTQAARAGGSRYICRLPPVGTQCLDRCPALSCPSARLKSGQAVAAAIRYAQHVPQGTSQPSGEESYVLVVVEISLF